MYTTTYTFYIVWIGCVWLPAIHTTVLAIEWQRFNRRMDRFNTTLLVRRSRFNWNCYAFTPVECGTAVTPHTHNIAQDLTFSIRCDGARFPSGAKCDGKVRPRKAQRERESADETERRGKKWLFLENIEWETSGWGASLFESPQKVIVPFDERFSGKTIGKSVWNTTGQSVISELHIHVKIINKGGFPRMALQQSIK